MNVIPDEPSRGSGARSDLLAPCQSPAGLAPCGRHLIVARRQAGTHGHDPSSAFVKLQVFNADGSAWGPEITIDAAAQSNLFHPTIAALADGRFALAWEEAMGPGAPAQLILRIQIFNADGSRWEPMPPICTDISGE